MAKFKVGDRVKFVSFSTVITSGESGIVIEVRDTSYMVQFSHLLPMTCWTEELILLNPIECPLVTTVLNTQSGTKFDNGKPDLSLLSPIAINKIASVLTYGKGKYDAHNWRKGFPFTRVSSAVLRHVFAWIGGETNDPETGISHLAHAACGLMFLLEFEETHPQNDDRYKGGQS
jgi:hypothetical protein